MYNAIEYKKEYRKRNRVRLAAEAKRWREENPEKYRLQQKKYRDEGRYKEWRKAYMKVYNAKQYSKNPEYHRLRARKWWQNRDSEKVKLYNKVYHAKRIKADINFRLQQLFRKRINAAIKRDYGIKAYKSTELLDCSIANARKYLEGQFRDGMSWENYGKVWEIDHKLPISSFNLVNPKEQKKCFHYSNLQPLFTEENRIKGDKIMI
jgi:hypothetical protein